MPRLVDNKQADAQLRSECRLCSNNINYRSERVVSESVLSTDLTATDPSINPSLCALWAVSEGFHRSCPREGRRRKRCDLGVRSEQGTHTGPQRAASRAHGGPQPAGHMEGHSQQGTYRATASRAHTGPQPAGHIQGHNQQGTYRSTSSRAHTGPQPAGHIQGHIQQGTWRATASKAHTRPQRTGHVQCHNEQGTWRATASRAHGGPQPAGHMESQSEQGTYRATFAHGRDRWERG